ncbi:hypothetical protein KC317_g11062 [Hortaea werneckii]|nr:hypothetical protein KC317_g11062 [Hortaea werneckii]KAI7587771.1 hypothetical protein KC346_g17168 [Hortaea werneckii]KAI7686810.1 hypothetical protein KC322_g12631 [Hortaea werneckii]
MPSVVLPYRPTDYCDYCHLQHDWVPKPVWILHTLAPTVRTCPTPVDPTCPSVPTSYVNIGGYTRAGCYRQLPDGEKDDNVEIRQLDIVNGTTPADGQCVRFTQAVSSVIYFLTGSQLPDNCRIGYYETYDCTDGAFRTLGLVEREQTCSSPGRKTRSLKITCGGGYGPHY